MKFLQSLFWLNPAGFVYFGVGIPAMFGFVVRAIHYWPVKNTAGFPKEEDLFMPVICVIIWPIAVVIIGLYMVAMSFAKIVRACWPLHIPPPPDQYEIAAKKEVARLLPEDRDA